MKNLYRYSPLRVAILAAMLGTSSSAYADTIIDKDTLIDENASANERYQVEGGATLTAKEATSDAITIKDKSHLEMNGGRVNGSLMVHDGGTANVSNATLNYAFLYGNAQLANTTIKSQLVVIQADLAANGISAKQLYGAGGRVVVDSGRFDDTGSKASPYGGAVYLFSSDGSFSNSAVTGDNSAFYLEGGGTTRYALNLVNTSAWAINGPAFQVAYGNHDIALKNGSTAGSQTGELLVAGSGSNVSLSINASQAAGDIRAERSAIVDVALANGGQLSGGMSNVNSLTLDGTSQYVMTADSDIKTLSLAGGTVKISSSSPRENHTLTLGSLSGNGHFYMNVDAATWQGDLLDVTGSATGRYTINLAANGKEAASRDALALVRKGSGDAEFALSGGRVDMGAWQHELVSNGNQWELVQAAGSTSASTDAMLSMASAPMFMHEAELNVLSSRLMDIQQDQQSGAWGTAFYNRNDVNGAWDSAYRLNQSGMMLGGDKVAALDSGELTTGAFISQSSAKVKHARGGDSRISAWGGGLYALLNSANGWYTSGSAQVTHFDSKLSARMSDGATASSSWNSWGYGLGLEGGRHIEIADSTTLTPFIGVNGWLNQSDTVSLNNGLTAQTGKGRSLRTEAGMRIATSASVGEMVVTPYAKVALAQELLKSESTRINDAHDFTNDFSGTGGRLSGGISVKISPATSVWTDVSYSKSEHTESPIAGNAGLRVNF